MDDPDPTESDLALRSIETDPRLAATFASVEERRRPRNAAAQLAVQPEAMTAAAEDGCKDHDAMTRNLLGRKLEGRRATSKTPGAPRLRADPADRVGRHDCGSSQSHLLRRKTSSPNSACARRRGEGRDIRRWEYHDSRDVAERPAPGALPAASLSCDVGRSVRHCRCQAGAKMLTSLAVLICDFRM